MATASKLRIFLTGVGGQGTLTATNILSLAALDAGIDIVSGEIHGMAQRGGVVESTVLLGGYRTPRISHGEAHILLGFEPLETLRGLPYLAPGGKVIASSEIVPPIGVALGRETYPDLDELRAKVEGCAEKAWFVPIQSLAMEAGTILCANMVLLGALAASGLLPFGLDVLGETIKKNLAPKIVDLNLRAIELGAGAME